METKTYQMCGGCGADHPNKRCIGCMHSFYPGDWPEKYEKPVQPSAEDRLATALSVQKQLVEALEVASTALYEASDKFHVLSFYIKDTPARECCEAKVGEMSSANVAVRAAILATKASS